MSGRSCSLACAVFFPRDVVTSEESPERTDAEAMPLFGEVGLDLHERDVVGPAHQRQDQIRLRLDTVGMAVAALRFAFALPVSRSSAHQRTALAALTPNRSAACRRDMPPETAATTRSRRSSERGLDMQAGVLRQHAG